jgi:hypothetical protein
MVCKNLNDIVDKMSVLITYQSNWIAKPWENEFIDEFYYHRHYIGA